MHTRALALLTLALLLCAAPLASAQEKWFPSKYGADDTLGAVNLLTPELTRSAAGLVKTGKTYALGVETGPKTPPYPPRSYQIFTFGMTPEPLGSSKTTYNDDFVSTWFGIGSQIDGLGHVGIDHLYYNGVPDSEFVRPNGLTRFGTHAIPPIVTRGVLLDIAGLRQVAMLEGGSAINQPELEAAAARQGVELRRGDVVLLHTGWLAMSESEPQNFLETSPGLGVGGARYLAELGAVAVGADTWGVEVIPSENPEQSFPVHQQLLTRNGVYLLENLETRALVADQGWEFMFVLGQPRFVGAVQMVINPIAIR